MRIPRLLLLVVALLPGGVAAPWCAGPKFTKGVPIDLLNVHGTLVSDALRVGEVRERGTVTRANYQPACYRHMYPMLPEGLASWPKLDREHYPDLYKFQQDLYDGASHEAHSVYRTAGAFQRDGVWLTDPRDHAIEYLDVYSLGRFARAYRVIGFRLHCEQDLEVPSHQKVCNHAFGRTTVDRSELFSAFDVTAWGYSSTPDDPSVIFSDARMPMERGVPDLPICLADVEDDDTGDEQPDRPDLVWSRDGPFDPVARGLDGPASSGEGPIAYWSRPDGGVLDALGRRPAPDRIVMLRDGVWGTYGGHPEERVPGLNGGVPGSPNLEGDVRGDFFFELPWMQTPAEKLAWDARWVDLLHGILLRTRNRTIKAMVEASHSLPPYIDGIRPVGSARFEGATVAIVRGGDQDPELEFRVQDNRSAELVRFSVSNSRGFVLRDGVIRDGALLDRTPDDDKRVLPFARTFRVPLRDLVPDATVAWIAIDVEDTDRNGFCEEIPVRLVAGRNSLDLRAMVEPDPVIAGREALFHADLTLEGFGIGSPNRQDVDVRHRWICEGETVEQTETLRVADGTWASEVHRTFDESAVGRRYSYEVTARLLGDTPRTSTAHAEFTVRKGSLPDLAVGTLALDPDDALGGESWSTSGSITVGGLDEGETAEIEVVESLVGPTTVELDRRKVTLANGRADLDRNLVELDRRFRTGDYRYRVALRGPALRTASGVSEPAHADMGPLRLLGAAVAPVAGDRLTPGTRAVLRMEYELFGPWADEARVVGEHHRLQGPVMVEQRLEQTRAAGGPYVSEVEFEIPRNAPRGEGRYVAAVEIAGLQRRELEVGWVVEEGRLRILDLRAVPDEVPPGESVYFELRFQRLDLPPGRVASVVLEREISGPAPRVETPKTIAVPDSSPREFNTRWQLPDDLPEGDYRFAVRLVEEGADGNEARREVGFRVTRDARPTVDFLQVTRAWATGVADGDAGQAEFRYRDPIWLKAAVRATEFRPDAPLLVSWVTRGVDGELATPVSQGATDVGAMPESGTTVVWMQRTVVLPGMLPGLYETTITVRLANRFGEQIERSGTLRFTVEDPLPQLEVWTTDREGGAPLERFSPGDPCVVYARPVVQGVRGEVDARLEFTQVAGPVPLAPLPFARDRKFANGGHDLYFALPLPPDHPDAAVRIRARVILNLFPENEGGTYYRWSEHTLSVFNPFSNLRFEIAPDPAQPGGPLDIALCFDVSGLEPGLRREATLSMRANGGAWSEETRVFVNGPAARRITDQVPEDYPREFIHLEGVLRSGGIAMHAEAQVRVQVLPTIRITSPADGARTQEKVLTVTGTCADRRVTEGQFALNGTPHAIPLRDGSFSEKVVLKPGWNEVTIAARNAFATRSATVRVFADIRPSFFKAVLTWNTDGTDVDLWVTDPQGVTTNYQKKAPAEGRKLDLDDTNGHGPETYTIEAYVPGRYVVRVQYYRGDVPTSFRLDVTSREQYTDTRSGGLVRGAGNERRQGSTAEFAFTVR